MAVSNLAYSNSQACDICNITTYLVLLRILLQLHESTPFLATTQKLIYIKALCRGGGLSNNEAAFLVAMQWIIGGIQIKDDLFRGLLVGVEEEVDEQAFDCCRIVADLVVSRRLGAAQFQPVQRRFARQRRTV